MNAAATNTQQAIATNKMKKGSATPHLQRSGIFCSSQIFSCCCFILLSQCHSFSLVFQVFMPFPAGLEVSTARLDGVQAFLEPMFSSRGPKANVHFALHPHRLLWPPRAVCCLGTLTCLEVRSGARLISCRKIIPVETLYTPQIRSSLSSDRSSSHKA
jgi:hypothetical protein